MDPNVKFPFLNRRKTIAVVALSALLLLLLVVAASALRIDDYSQCSNDLGSGSRLAIPAADGSMAIFNRIIRRTPKAMLRCKGSGLLNSLLVCTH